MAVAFRSSTGVVGETFTTTATVVIPADVQAGDDLYCQAAVNENASDAVACTCTDDDSGGNTWAELVRGTNGNSWLWHKKATSGTASKTITVANAEDSVSALVAAYSGGASGDPTTNLSFEANASGDVTHAGFTPDFADSMICLANFNYVNDLVVATQACTNPGTLTEQDEATSTGGADCQTSHASALQAAGPTATGNFTWTQTNAASQSLVWAIKPATGSGAVTGTATASINESDIVTGGKTVIVTVSNETYVANSTIPVSFSASGTLNSGSNTASTIWFVSTQGVSTNDLVIWHIGWDDSTNTASVAASTAPSGQAISTLMGPVASINTEVRSQIYWAIATTSWAASTTRFTPAAAESWTATVLRIPAGFFNSSSPFGSKSTYNANTSTGAQVSSPSFSCTTSDAIGRLVAFNTIDTDPITAVPAGWVSTNALDLGAVAHGLSYRTSTVAASESIASESWTIAGDSSVTHSYILKAYSQNAFDDARQAFINGCDSAQLEGTGWDAVVKAGQHVSTVVRTSDTVVTMTLSAYASYNISAQETITVSVPGSILTGAGSILASPTFTIDTVGGGGGTFFMHDKLLLLGVS